MENKPEEIKEFWEWSGLGWDDYSSLAMPHCGGAWVDSLGKTVNIDNPMELPPIDLNNLFKYAVPQFAVKFGVTKTRELLHHWINDAYMSLPEAKDLMLAIQEVIKCQTKK